MHFSCFTLCVVAVKHLVVMRAFLYCAKLHFAVLSAIRPSAAVNRDGLMESCTCCGGAGTAPPTHYPETPRTQP